MRLFEETGPGGLFEVRGQVAGFDVHEAILLMDKRLAMFSSRQEGRKNKSRSGNPERLG
jgi:hypothetical protein